jgi:hypothetical protein
MSTTTSLITTTRRTTTSPSRFKRLTTRLRALEVAQPTSIFLSDNSKTGFSINTAIPLTCRPTAACQKYCYGLVGRICMTHAIARQVANVKRFKALEAVGTLEITREAVNIASRILRRQNFLRFFGVGDLQQGSVRFINTLAAVAPELRLWVATRRFDDAARIAPQENVHVMMGLDATTRPADIVKARKLLRKYPSQYFMSWVQRAEKEQVPSWVSVVFAEHQMTHRAAWTRKNKDPRTCMATVAGGTKHDNACAKCQRCFNTEKRLN